LKKLNKTVLLIIVSVIVLIGGTLGIVGLGAYRMNWDNKYVNAIIDGFNFPAAIVNGHIIKYSDFRIERKALSKLNALQGGQFTAEKVDQEVVTKLINDELLKEIARAYKISVTPEDTQTYLDSLIQQYKDEAGLKQLLQESFGWDLETFKTHLLAGDVLNDKLTKNVPGSDLAVVDAEKTAKEVLKKLQDGAKFEDLAKEYSADTGSAQKGGDLGWFKKGEMVPEFETAAFSLKKGETSGLVRTKYGYHIIRVDDVKAADEATKTEAQVKASHILIATKYMTDVMAEYQKDASVFKFVGLDKK
jgi:foldase protein PrsA